MKLRLRSLSILLTLLMALTLCSCTKPPVSAAEAGVYHCTEIVKEEDRFTVEELYPKGCSLELMGEAKAVLDINGEQVSARWQHSGEDFMLELGGIVCRGTYKDGCVIIDLGEGLVHSFLLSGGKAPEKTEVPAPLPGVSMWNGDWYGFWTISEAGGKWAQLNGQSFDLFGRIELDENGEGSFILWDEQLSAGEPMARLEIFAPMDTETLGLAAVSGGWFWLMEPEAGSWSITGDAHGISGLISIEEAEYSSDEGSFRFSLFLRPWGWLWDDIPADSGLPLPYFYYDWYLPLVEQSQPMPERFSPPAVNTENGEQQ